MRLLAPLAMSVELFAEETDTLSLIIGGVGERERFETGRLHVDWVISEAEPAAGRKRPGNVNAAGEDSEDKCIARRYVDKFVIRRIEASRKTKKRCLAVSGVAIYRWRFCRAGRKALRVLPKSHHLAAYS